MKCKNCGKDITSMHYFTGKEHCDKDCEKKERRKSASPFDQLFSSFKK